MLVKSTVKYIQTLSQKKERDKEGVFLAEGPKIVQELLMAAPQQVLALFATPVWIDGNKLLLQNIDAEIHEVTSFELEKISQLATPNQVLAIVKQFAEEPVHVVKGEWILALDTIQDPGNMGTIIRIADWFGVKNIVCSSTCADRYNPKVVQSTMASIVRVNIQYTDLPKWLKQQTDCRIYGAVLDGQPVSNINAGGGGVLLIGNESKGISTELLQMINVKVTIPQKGQAESLNAAVAAGIILSHIIS